MEFEAGKQFVKGELRALTEEYEGIPLIICVGEAGADTISALNDALQYAIDTSCCELMVDIRTMDYMDTAGFYALVHARKKIEEEKKGTMVVVDLVEPVARVVKLLGLDSLISFVATYRQAADRIKRSRMKPPKAG